MVQILQSPVKIASQTDDAFGTETTKTLEQSIQEATEYARYMSLAKGSCSSESAVAWEVVEELLAAKSHRHQGKSLTAFDFYCTQNPDAPECRIYEA